MAENFWDKDQIIQPSGGNFWDGDQIAHAPIATPTAGDYVKTLASGVNNIITTAGQGLKYVGANKVGTAIRDYGQNNEAYWNDDRTEGGKRAAEGKLLNDDWTLADNPHPFHTAALGAAQSLPGMAAMAVPGAGIAAGIGKGIKAAGAAGKLAGGLEVLGIAGAKAGKIADKAADWLPGAIGMGASEGAYSGLANAAQFAQENRGISQSASDAAENEIANRTALATGGIGMLTGGGVLGQMTRKMRAGVVKEALGGMGKEALQEGLQSPEEQVIQNIAKRDHVDPMQDIYEGVANATALGAASGGMLGAAGGGFHGLAHGKSPDAAPQNANAEQEQSPVAGILAEHPHRRTAWRRCGCA